MTGAELLAPAGDGRALQAALAAGADAVYFGLERWSARAFAGNFAGDAAAQAVETAHRWGRRAYLALNTLLKDDEIETALEALRAPYLAGVDALIVADAGFATRVRAAYPDLPLHASTQLDTHSSLQLSALARLGFSRAILARELSLAEIAALDPHGLELEAFVHGALCYGYSGDCLLGSMVGGRSGNRGRCSQACRMRYALRLEGSAPSAPARVMSTSDLAAIAALPRLLAAGVTSLKIEGRMKDAAYVAVTTAVYREALDAALADPEGYEVLPQWWERLEQSFSRSFTTAHLDGRHDEVRSGGRGGHRGVLVGRVRAVDAETGTVEVKLSRPVAEGDVVSLYTPWGQTEPRRLEAGGDESLTLRVREHVAVKDRLFRLAAAEVGELGRALLSGRLAFRPVPVRMRLAGREGSPAELTLTAVPGGETVTATTPQPLPAARTAALDRDGAVAALGALGGTPYRLAELEYDVEGEVFIAVGALKDLRRRALAALDERRVAAGRRTRECRAAGAPEGAAPGRAPACSRAALPQLVLRLRPETEASPGPPGAAVCLDVRAGDSPAAVAGALESLRAAGAGARLRLPEVLPDADEAWATELLAMPWDAVVVRSLGLLEPAARLAPRAGLVIEYPLQGLNHLVVAAVEEVAGTRPVAVTVSPESSLAEIARLAAALADAGGDAPPVLEVLAFGRQQVLHARDRLGLAEGLYEAPGPGAHVAMVLEDGKGYAFPAEADARGTRVFNARVTNLAGHVDELREAGVRTFIVEPAAMDAAERAAFAAGGLEALARCASRERSTTGHLFRGVA